MILKIDEVKHFILLIDKCKEGIFTFMTQENRKIRERINEFKGAQHLAHGSHGTLIEVLKDIKCLREDKHLAWADWLTVHASFQSLKQ